MIGIKIAYQNISLEELDRIAFLHQYYDFVCDADTRCILIENNNIE